MAFTPAIGTRVRVYMIRGDPNDVFATGDYAGTLGSEHLLRNVSIPGDSTIVPGPLGYETSEFAIASIVPTPVTAPSANNMYLIGGRRRKTYRAHAKRGGSRRLWHRSRRSKRVRKQK
jgi:hypothetical protein